ncbi:hypothetical protein NPIL_474091 [Nephila pilipes]|uniref:Uncharacterized protein n=1 Tax=Nephila pilipes TaxID=299642 RepID=A0A8X6TKK4_NEPPI|nr:hypothetical protein NPIL_474091 [Nephila pilipes]
MRSIASSFCVYNDDWRPPHKYDLLETSTPHFERVLRPIGSFMQFRFEPGVGVEGWLSISNISQEAHYYDHSRKLVFWNPKVFNVRNFFFLSYG